MSELTKEFFEQKLEAQTKELKAFTEDKATEILVFLTDKAVHKDDFDKKFAEQAVSLSFIESQLAALRKDFGQLSKRTKEDDSAFVKDLLKLKNRMDQFERQLKKLKAVHA